MRKKNFAPGFTLAEVLVSIVIGGIVLASAMSIYSVFSASSIQISTSQELQREVHFALARISDRIRSHSVNYDAYGIHDIATSTNRLHIKDPIGTTVLFEDEKLLMSNEPLISNNKFLVSEARFIVTPTLDPFSESLTNFDYYRQPRVAIELQVESRQYPDIRSKVQTTVSSRVYQ